MIADEKKREELREEVGEIQESDVETVLYLLRQTFDRDLELTKLVFARLNPSLLNKEMFNLLAWSSANFNDHEFLMTLLFENPEDPKQLDLQTYLKCVLSFYNGSYPSSVVSQKQLVDLYDLFQSQN
jgi:hypothetical protein